MRWQLFPKKHVQGKINLPSDKSIAHRALLLAALAEGQSEITVHDMGDDNHSTLQCLRDLSVPITRSQQTYTVDGRGLRGLKASEKPLDCGNSGTTLRLLTGILAAQAFRSVLTGDASVSKRPMRRVLEPLAQMGAQATLTDGALPLTIEPAAAWQDLTYAMPVASAQLKSALLLAGLCAGTSVTLTQPLASRDHTERMLQSMGVTLQLEGNQLHLPAQTEPLKPLKMTVPGDFSAAAFFLAAACLATQADITLPNVNINPTRTGFLRYIILMNAKVTLTEHRWCAHEPVADLHIKHTKFCQAIKVLPEHVPSLIDELPLLFLLAARAKGVSEFPNVGELRHKESDRLDVMIRHLKALGAGVRLEGDTLYIEGVPQFKGGVFDSFGDHRIAMTLAVASVACEEEIQILGADCCKISFPSFLRCIRGIGLSCTEKEEAA